MISIQFKSSTILSLAAGAVLFWWFYKTEKKRAKERAEFEAYRKEKICDRSINETVEKASISNEKIENYEDRATAKEILVDKKIAIYGATTMSELDAAIDAFNTLAVKMTFGSKEEILSNIKYYKNRKEERRREYELRRQEALEREKISKMSNTAIDIANMAFNKGGVTI